MMYGAWEWDMERKRQFFVIFYHFLPFYSPINLENKNFVKMKKVPQDIIILQTCTINDSHIMYGSWDTECNRQNFFVVLDCFLPFYNPKNQNFEKMKKIPGDITISHMCTINDNHMMYGSWDIERNGHNFLSFWTIFALLPS